MNFVECTQEEFTTFADQHPLSNLWQTKNMAQMREKRGFETSYVGLKENDKLVAATMLSSIPTFLGYKTYYVLRGPLIDFDDQALFKEFHQGLVEYLKQHKCLYFHMDPYIPYQEHNLDGDVVEDGFDHKNVVSMLLELGYTHEGFTTGINDTREPRWIYTIPFHDYTSDELLKTMERKTIRSIKKALKYNVQVRELEENELMIFDEVIQNTGDRRGFSWRDHTYTQRLYDAYAKDGYVKFLVATLDLEDYKKDLMHDLQDHEKVIQTSQQRLEKQESPKIRRKMDLSIEQVSQIEKKLKEADEIIARDGQVLTLASGIFFTYGREVLCLMSGVYEQYMHFAAPYAMHWKMIQYGIEHGMERYNLYGISGIFDKSAPDYGVYLFKKGFQGEVIELIGDFEYVVSPGIYKLYQSLRQIKHKIKG